jgi:hypothetical protein
MWRLPGPGVDDTALGLAPTASGDVYVAGVAGGASSSDAIVAGVSSTLLPLWPVIVVDRAGHDDTAESLALAPGAVYAAGVSGPDLLVIRVLR